jgi:hypothetical protein
MAHQCLTPCTLQFGRKDEFSVAITKNSYHPEQVQVVTKVAGDVVVGLAGNVVLGGVVDDVADVASGATLKHCSNPVVVTLQPISKPHGRTDYTGRCNPPLQAETNTGSAQ